MVLVLDHPQDIVNIGGVIRVMMNFGVSRLRLVNPDDFDPYRIEGIAHRSMPLIEATTLHTSLEDAVSDCSWVLGTTARARTAGRNYARPRDVAPELVARAREGSVAVLFGREDKGLFNEGLDLCHAVAIIPTDPSYSSLNLAQAALVILYEAFLAAQGQLPELPRGRRATRPPTQTELETTYRALEEGLHTIEFFKARKPATVMRTLRTLISKADPDMREARLLAAMGFEVGHYIRRTQGGTGAPGDIPESEAGDGDDGGRDEDAPLER